MAIIARRHGMFSAERMLVIAVLCLLVLGCMAQVIDEDALRKLTLPEQRGVIASVEALPDGHTIAVAYSKGGGIALVDTSTWNIVRSIPLDGFRDGVRLTTSHAQRTELYDNRVVRDSVQKQIEREMAAGLWSADIASGRLKGSITLRITVDTKGRATSVFVPESDLPINWKNAVKDHWYDHRFDLRLPKGHTEQVEIALHFP